MSSLWTPGGEHPVPDDHDPSPAEDLDGFGGDQAGAGLDDGYDLGDEELDPETFAAVQAEMAEVRRRLASVPAEQVVANHAMGLYELAAIHLSQDPPNLPSAALAIDGLGALVESLGDRLGEVAPVLRDALAQIRLAFVQVRSNTGG